MKQPTNRYRYKITNLLGVNITAPFGESGFSLEWDLKDEDLLDYSKNLPGKIVFTGPEFQKLYAVEKLVNRCDLNYISVERFCGGAWVPWFTGRFSLNDATWDLYRCRVEIKLDKFEDEDCLDDKKSTEINLFTFATNRQTIRLYKNNVVITTVSYQETTTGGSSFSCNSDTYWPGPGTAEGNGYSAYYQFYQTAKFGVSGRICFKETRWARQELTLPVSDPSPGNEWILISTGGGNNVWGKPAALYDCVEEQLLPEGSVLGGYRKECKILGQGGGITEIDNGMKLADCLQAFLSNFCAGYTVKSEFFQINPDVITAINYVTGQPSKTRNIVVFQKSDVKRPSVSGNATKAEISFEKFMTALVKMFNVRWRVVGNVLRIEHVSYFNRTAGADLTVGKYAEYIKTMAKYSYKTEQIPAREEFKFMEASAGDFAGLPIIYTGGCVTQGGRQTVTTNAAENVTTDVELCLANPDPKNNVVDDKGFVFTASDDTNLILSEAPILNTATRLNNTLAWAQLHRDYHRHYRALKTGMMNGQPTTFLSVKPLKKGETIHFALCCGDTFNPDDLIKTTLGDGVVEKATFSFKNDILAVDLLYPADDALITPPTANNDVFSMLGGALFADLDVIANDTAGTNPIASIEIVTPPSHGTAVVIAGPKIRYTPSPGYGGDDNIVYRLRDSINAPSNNALVAITIP